MWQLQQPDLPSIAYANFFRQNVWIGFLMLAGMIGGYLLP
jgi:4-hydroxybenzoate polyprenyltransferase